MMLADAYECFLLILPVKVCLLMIKWRKYMNYTNYTTEYQDYPKVKRNYKDTLFCMIFGKKEDLLNL